MFEGSYRALFPSTGLGPIIKLENKFSGLLTNLCLKEEDQDGGHWHASETVNRISVCIWKLGVCTYS